MNRSALLPAAALALLVPLALTGCSNPIDTLQKRISGTADTRTALLDAWSTPASDPDWVPADASDVRYVAGTAGQADATPGTVRVTTASALPASCTEVERRSLDSFGEDWAVPVKDLPETVQRCGNWIVVPAEGGWFGWTPLSPGEAEQP